MKYASFKKLQTVPAGEGNAAASLTDMLEVIVKTKLGSVLPDYVIPRSVVSANIFTSVISGMDLRRLENDPAIEAVSISQKLPLNG